ncbi:MAG: YgiT-type zinc finger protein [Chloroflexi bacterium]|jgi:YgiT-type zinc finger domain-containing protein|nr:YgiT-type zinc finger protein [Chloroflexota bacterium]
MSENENASTEQTFPCPECQSGLMHLKSITYITWLGNELITVPDFPAWVCDVCGRREYDERAIAWLNLLLAPSMGKPLRTSRRSHRAPRQPRPRSSNTRTAR